MIGVKELEIRRNEIRKRSGRDVDKVIVTDRCEMRWWREIHYMMDRDFCFVSFCVRFVLCPFCFVSSCFVSVSFRFVSIRSFSFEFTSTVIACAASVAAAAASSMAFLRATASTSR